MSSGFSRILVPVDFSDCSRAALDLAAGLGYEFGATVDVLHVWQPSATVLPLIGDARPLSIFVRSEAGQEMKQFLATAELRGVEVRGRLEPGEPVDAILRCAQAEGYDLIVMGTKGHSGLSHFVHPNVAERVVRKAPCPVMMVRPS